MYDLCFDNFVSGVINGNTDKIINKKVDDEVFDEFVSDSIKKNKVTDNQEREIERNQKIIDKLTKENKDLNDLMGEYATTPEDIKKNLLKWSLIKREQADLYECIKEIKDLNKEYNKLNTELKKEIKDFEKECKHIYELLHKGKFDDRERAFKYSWVRCNYQKSYYENSWYEDEDV